jgi:hypothetical protein
MKILVMKATRWNSPSLWSWDRTAPVAKFEAACVSGEGEDRGGGDSLLEGLECAVLVWSPGPYFRLSGQSVEGASLLREVLDEPVVEVYEA